MTKNKHPVKKASRMISMILALAALPFVVSVLSHKIANRKVASNSEQAALDTATNSVDLSESTDEEFQKAFKYQLLKEAKVTDFSDGKKLHLGFFFMRNEQGQKVSVCERYPGIELTFTADGVAFAGESPKATIRAACQVAADGLHLEGIAIDLPADNNYQWNWTGLKLVGSNANDSLSIDGYEIISVLGEPLSF